MFSAVFVCLSFCLFTMGSHVTHTCNALGQSQATWNPPVPAPTHLDSTPFRDPIDLSDIKWQYTMQLSSNKFIWETPAIHMGTSPYKHHSNLFNLDLTTQGPPSQGLDGNRTVGFQLKGLLVEWYLYTISWLKLFSRCVSVCDSK